MRIALTISDDLLARVDTAASNEGVSRSEMIRRACDVYTGGGDVRPPATTSPSPSPVISPDDIIEEDRYLADRAAEMVHLQDEVKRLTRENEDLTAHKDQAVALGARLEERQIVIDDLRDRVASQEKIITELQHQAGGHIATVQALTAGRGESDTDDHEEVEHPRSPWWRFWAR
ncbi:MAG: ribbon-helix-helix domain-containing protein [Methanofollis sp.]|nr:ribbon-helix-helix domain-containing protein [Methanofollis sp.]